MRKTLPYAAPLQLGLKENFLKICIYEKNYIKKNTQNKLAGTFISECGKCHT